MLLGQLDRRLFGRGDAHHLVASIAHDVGDVERDHRLVLDHQDPHGGNPLQLAPSIFEAALGLLETDIEDMPSVFDGEPFEHGEQQDLSLQRCHVGERLLQAAADAILATIVVEIAERLLQAMEKGEYAELGIFCLSDEVGLLEHDLCTQPHPFVAPLLRAGDGACIAAQERQRAADRLGNLVGRG